MENGTKIGIALVVCITTACCLAIYKYYETRQYAFELGYIEQQTLGGYGTIFVKPK